MAQAETEGKKKAKQTVHISKKQKKSELSTY
jgi:hypothetical protein